MVRNHLSLNQLNHVRKSHNLYKEYISTMSGILPLLHVKCNTYLNIMSQKIAYVGEKSPNLRFVNRPFE